MGCSFRLSFGSEGLRFGSVPFRAELICGAGFAVLLANFRWFSEHRMLLRSRFPIRTVISAGQIPKASWVTYQFFDTNRERRGGREQVGSISYGNAVLVFFTPDHPDLNS